MADLGICDRGGQKNGKKLKKFSYTICGAKNETKQVNLAFGGQIVAKHMILRLCARSAPFFAINMHFYVIFSALAVILDVVELRNDGNLLHANVGRPKRWFTSHK